MLLGGALLLCFCVSASALFLYVSLYVCFCFALSVCLYVSLYVCCGGARGLFVGGRPPLAYIFEDILLTKMNKQLNTSLRVVLANLNA